MTGVVSILNIIITVFSIYWGLQIYISDKSREIILPKNGKNNITKEDIAFMIIITLIYSLIAFYRLGDTKSPQTFYTVDNDVILDLTENKHIGKLMIYQGIVSSDAKIYFEGSDNGVSWQPLNFKTEKGITNEDSFHPVFNWQNTLPMLKLDL